MIFQVYGKQFILLKNSSESTSRYSGLTNFFI